MGGRDLVRTMLLELLGTPARVDEGLLEALADHAHAARLGDGAEGLAAGQGVTLARFGDLPSGLDGFAVDAVLAVRWRRDEAVELLAALHELAHPMLANLDHTHADVWRLALALGAPARVARIHCDPVALAAATGLPAAAAEMRLRMLLKTA